MKSIGFGGLAAAIALAFGPARVQAQPPGDARALQTQSLAATCAACHGTAGQAIDGATVPGLGGLPAATLAEQMRSFKSGARAATVMQQIAKGYNDAQIDQLAAFFAAQPKGAAR